MSENKVYMSNGLGVLTISCIFKDEIIFDGSLFKGVMRAVLNVLNLDNASKEFRQRLYNTATVNNFTKTSAEIDVDDPNGKITAMILKYKD